MRHGGTAIAVAALASLAALSLAATGCSCSDPGDVPAPPQAADAKPPRDLPYLFTDVTREAGLAGFVQVNGDAEKLFVVESFGAGVALSDFDGDGDMDAYLTNGSKLEGLEPGKEPRDALYLNDGAARFTDGTDAAKLGDTRWTCGVRTVDLDSDGDVELYLTNYGPNVLYDNLGDGTFADVTERAGVGDPRWSTGAAFLDFDRDGDLDLFVGNYLEFDEATMLRDRPTGTMNGHSQSLQGGQSLDKVAVMKGPMGLPPAKDRFYLNDGGGRFHDASDATGISGPANFSFQVLVFDVDLDGWLDVLVVNDVMEDLLWHNDHGELFTESSLHAGVAVRQDGIPQGGMGGAVGDYDGDGFLDLWIANYVEDYSTLFRGAKGGFFTDVTNRVGLRRDTWTMVGWACDFVDFDSDGDPELFQVNGHVYPQVDLLDLGTSYRQPMQLWELRDGRFVVPDGGGGPDFTVPRAGRGAALGDVDGDGDVDLLVGNLDAPPTLLRNDGPNGNRLLVHLVGSNGNRDAIGARMVLTAGGKRQVRLVGESSGFLSSHDPREHFGLGAAARADELEVTWPDGRVERFTGLAAGSLHTIQDGGPEGTSSLRSTPLGQP